MSFIRLRIWGIFLITAICGTNLFALGNDPGQEDSLLMTANAAYNRGETERALEYYFRYLDICREKKDRRGEGEALRKIGDTFRAIGDHPRCLEYLEKAKSIAFELNDRHLLARIYNRMAADYFELRDVDRAYLYADSSLMLTKELDYPEFQANNLNILGAIAMSSNDFEKAISYLEQSLELQRELGDTADLPNVMNNIAHTWFLAGKYDKSIEIARASLAASQRDQSLPYQHYALLMLTQNFKARHQYDSALVYHERYKGVTDSIAKTERRQAVNQLESKYKIEAQERENELLRKEKELEQQTGSKLMTLATGLTVVLLLMVVTLILLLLSRRQRIQAHRLLEQEMAKVERQKAEIEDQRRSLEENNQIRDRLFSVIAHDLRSPLNSLQGIMHLMKANTLNEQEIKTLLRGLNDRVDSTSMLVDNLLNWAKSQLQGFQVLPSKTDLAAIVSMQLKVVAPHAEAKGITLVNDIGPGAAVFADPSMVEVMVRNLVSNAVKFTPRGGTIRVFTEEKGDGCCLHVKDNGLGMTREVRSRLFTGNYFSTMGTAREAGSGLGLMLVKEFVEKNNGALDVESEDGKGSDFILCMPRA